MVSYVCLADESSIFSSERMETNRLQQQGRQITSYFPSYVRLQLDHVPTPELLIAVRDWIEVRKSTVTHLV